MILGIVTMTNSIPLSDCGSGIDISQSDKDAVNNLMTFLGMPVLIGGILSLLGGLTGAFGGFKANKMAVCGVAGLGGVAGGIMVIGLLMAMIGSAIFDDLCNKYDCEMNTVCPGLGGLGGLGTLMCMDANVCCRCDSYTAAMCKSTNDWACDMMTTKMVTQIFAVIGIITVILASGCGCGAACCCPNSFQEFAEAAAPPGGTAVNAVVGQPVGQAEGYDQK
jgi:hypothetical protein